jgi:hypothetical protein
MQIWKMILRGSRLPIAILLLILAGIAPALVLAATEANPSTARPGERVHFSADGFRPGERVDPWVTYPDGRSEQRYPAVEADSEGRAVWSWDVPADAPNGTYVMAARGVRSNVRVGITFEVVGSSGPQSPTSGSVSPSSGEAGATFTFNLSGYAAEEQIGAWLNDPNGDARDLVKGADPEIYADEDGNVTYSWTAPDDALPGFWQAITEGRSSGRQQILSFRINDSGQAVPAAGSVTPTEGAPGTSFTIQVDGLTASEEVGAWLNAPDGRRYDGELNLIAEEDGSVTWTWTAPNDAQAGIWQAVTYGTDSKIEIVLTLSITGNNPAPSAPEGPNLTVAPGFGEPGATFTFSGSGFKPGEDVAYWSSEPDGTPVPESVKVEADGDGNIEWEWQSSDQADPGTWTMSVYGESSRGEAYVNFTIVASDNRPAIAVNPSVGGPGTTFNFQAIGYERGERLNLWAEGPGASRIDIDFNPEADTDGSVTWSWTAPEQIIAGDWVMVAEGQESELMLRAGFRIERDTAPDLPDASVSPERGPRGTTFTFTADGYVKGERVGYWLNAPDGTIIRFDRELDANEDGVVTWSWTAPDDAQRGQWTLALRSSQNDREQNDVSHVIIFFVE